MADKKGMVDLMTLLPNTSTNTTPCWRTLEEARAFLQKEHDNACEAEYQAGERIAQCYKAEARLAEMAASHAD